MFQASRRLHQPVDWDIVVCGSGMVGLGIVRAVQIINTRLAGAPSQPTVKGENNAARKLSCALYEINRKPTYAVDCVRNYVRTVGLTPRSITILDSLGAFEKLHNKHPYYRTAIRHNRQHSHFQLPAVPPFLSLGSCETRCGHDPVIVFQDLKQPLGYVSFCDEISDVLVSRIEEGNAADAQGIVALNYDTKISDVHLPTLGSSDSVKFAVESAANKTETPSNNSSNNRRSCSLLVGADGRRSALRKVLACSAVEHDYQQTALVTTVRVEHIDDGNPCCFQNYFDDGRIVSYLPTSRSTANIILTTTESDAAALESSPTSVIVQRLNSCLSGLAPKDIPRIDDIVGDGHERAIGRYSLTTLLATRPFKQGLILVGDAFHCVHPMAGQGLNLWPVRHICHRR